METRNSPAIKKAEPRRRLPPILMVVLGPLMGLSYIIVLPIFSVVSFIFSSGYYGAHRLIKRSQTVKPALSTRH